MEIDVGLVMNALPNMVWTMLADGQVDFVNRSWEEYTGLRLSSPASWRWEDAVEPTDLPALTAHLTGVRVAGKTGSARGRLRGRLGELRHFLIQWNPILGASGEILKWCGIATDVEELVEERETSRTALDFQLVVDSIPIPVAVTTPTGEVEGLNKLTLSYFGLSLAELKGWKSSEVVHPDDLKETTEAQLAAHMAASSYNVESRHLRADGVYRWHNVLGLPLRDQSGVIQRWLHLLIDIDDRKRAEERAEQALIESERQARQIVNTIAGVIVVLGPDGRVEGANDQALEFMGRTLDQLQDWATNGMIHPDDLEDTARGFSSSIATGQPFDLEFRIKRRDESYCWFHVRGNPLRGEDGSIIRWYSFMSDIDDRKRAEVALADSERELRLIVHTVAGLIALFNPDGQLNGSNQQLLDYFQLPLEEVAKWATNGITHPDDLQVCIEHFTTSLQTGDPYEFETRFRRHDGVFRWFQVRGHPVRDNQGNIVRWYGLLTDIDDRRKAVEALRESQSELRLIVNSIQGLIIVLRPDGSVETVNDQSLRYFGYDFSEHQRWQTNDIIHPEDRDRGVARFVEAAAAVQPYEIVERLRRHDGEYRWFQLRGSPVLDQGGVVVRWYFLLNDIDDRVRAEVALANSEREFRHIVNMVPGMIILSQPDGTLDGSNKQLLDYFGITLDEVQDWSTNGITHPDDVQVNIDTFIGSLRSGEPYDYESRYRRNDGVFRWFQVRGQPLRDADGKIVRWYGLLTDIDDRKQVEEELRRSQAFLATGQRISRVGTFSWDIDTDKVTLSDECLSIFEFEEDDVVALDGLLDRILPEDLPYVAEKMTAVREGDESSEFDIRLQGRSGDIKYLRVIASVIRQDGHRESLGSIQDVTQTRLIEEAREQLRTELARVTGFLSLGQMSAAIAHEVNQPLSGILMNANTCQRMLSAEPPDIETALETARRTIRDARRAEEVIVRLRALFSKRSIAFEKLDLNDAVHEVVALTASDQRRNGIAVRTSFANALPEVNGDRVQLQQVISNLLRNAVDAVAGVRDRLRSIDVRTELDDDGQVRLAITDNGIGFGPDGPSRIFESFYTTKDDGMGIGLAVCRSIIETHGGTLWAQSNEGPGVTMYFSVPTASAEEASIMTASG